MKYIPKEQKPLPCKIRLRRMDVTREQMTYRGQIDCSQNKTKKIKNVFLSITPPTLCMGRISKVGQQINIFILFFLKLSKHFSASEGY